MTSTTTAPANGRVTTRSAKTRQPINARVGARIKALRMTHGMTQGALGERLGVTFQQIQKYENGTNRVAADRLQAIAGVFGVATNIFFDETTVHSDGKDPVTALFTENIGFRLARAFTSIPEQDIKVKIVRLVESIARTPATGV